MATADTVIRIVAKDEATKVLKSIGEASKVAMATIAAAGAAAAAGLALATKEAMAAEKSQRQLAVSLASFGKLTNQAYESNVAFADSLALATGKSDDYIASLLASSLRLLKNEQAAQKATQAALDWASATGGDATQAVEALAKAQNGQIRTLQMMVPEVRALTEEQIKNGAAIDLLAEKYRNAAANELQTFGGSLNAAKESMMDVVEAIGLAITKDSTFTSFLLGMRDAFKKLQKVVEDNKDSIAAFAKLFAVAIGKSMAFGVKAIGDATLAFWSLAKGIIDARIKLKEFDLAMADIPVLSALFPEKEVTEKAIAELSKMSRQLDRSGVESAGFKLAMDDVASSIDDAVNKLYTVPAAAKSVEEAFKNVGATSAYVAENIQAQNESQIEWLMQLTDAVVAYDDALTKANAEAANMPSRELIIDMQAESKAAFAMGNEMAIGFAAGLQNVMGGGLGGALGAIGAAAQAAIGQAMKDATDASSSQILGAVSALLPAVLTGIEMLANFSAEEFNAIIEAIMDSLVVALTNIGPMLVVLAENIDEIIIGLMKGTVAAVVSIAANLPAIIAELVGATVEIIFTSIPKIFSGIKQILEDAGNALQGAFKRIGDLFTGGIKQVWEEAFSGLRDQFRKFRDWIKDLFDNLTPDLSGVADFFSFDTGGIIPTPMGTPTPAVVHGGEMVLNPRQQQRMFEMFDSQQRMQSTGGTINVTIQERPMSKGEFRQVVLESIRDLIAVREIVDIRA